MTREEVFTHMRDTMARLFELDPARITLDADLREDLELDSIDAIDMVVELQRMTDRRLALDALKSVRTVGDVVEAAYEHLSHPVGTDAALAAPSRDDG